MPHHFHLRKSHEVRVFMNRDISIAHKIIHAISLFSVFSASAVVGFSFWEVARYPYFKGTDIGSFRPAERPETVDLDKFGGYKKKTGMATGYWHLETIDQKNTIIDPLGNAFTPFGVIKVRRGNYDDQAYQAEYKGRYSQWARETSVFMTSDLAMNFLGDRSEEKEFQKSIVQRLPYYVLGNFLSPEAPREDQEWPDPFSAEFLSKVQKEAVNLSRLYGNDQYFMGVKFSNESNINARNLDGTTNGWDNWWHVLIDPQFGHIDAQLEWQKFMELRYPDISTLNAVYGTSLTNYSELGPLGSDLFARFEDGITEDEVADAEIAFADVVYWKADFFGKFHQVISEELKKLMPNVLFGTDAFRDGTVEDPILAAIGPFTDLTILNYYIDASQFIPDENYINNYAQASGNPVLIGEFSFAQEPCQLSDDGATYPHVATQADRAEALLTYRDAALRIPSVVGTIWNELVDSPIHENPDKFECSYVNFGFQNRQLQPYQEMIDAGAGRWEIYNTVKWSSATPPKIGGDSYNPPLVKPGETDTAKEFGPVDLNPIDPKKSQWYHFDPVVRTPGEKGKWYKVDPLDPNAQPPFTMPGPDVIGKMFGESAESPQ